MWAACCCKTWLAPGKSGAGQSGTVLHSPGGQYVAVTSGHCEVWGNRLADIALWAVASPPRLLYYRAGYSAHALDVFPTDQPTFLYWSQAGDWLTFYEFKRQLAYQVVFMHVTTGQAYRVPATDELIAQLPVISQSGPQIEVFLQQAAPQVSVLVTDDAPAALLPPPST